MLLRQQRPEVSLRKAAGLGDLQAVSPGKTACEEQRLRRLQECRLKSHTPGYGFTVDTPGGRDEKWSSFRSVKKRLRAKCVRSAGCSFRVHQHFKLLTFLGSK